MILEQSFALILTLEFLSVSDWNSGLNGRMTTTKQRQCF